MSRLKVRFLSPAPRRSKVRFAPTIFLFEKQKIVVARFLAPPLRRKDRSRRLGAFALRAAFSFSFLRCSLRSQNVKGKDILFVGAICAPTLIPHSPLPIALPALRPPRRELRSFCVGGVSFCSSVPRLRRGKRARAFADFTCSRRRFFVSQKNAPPLLRGPPFSALAALA